MANLTIACIAGKEAFNSLSGYESHVEKARATLAESTTGCREKLKPLKAIMPEVHRMLNGRTEDFIRAFAENPRSEKFANLRTFLPAQTETNLSEDPEAPENFEKNPTPLAIRAKTKVKVV